MKKFLSIIFLVQILTTTASHLMYLDFESAMQIKQHENFVNKEKVGRHVGIAYDLLMHFFKTLYEKNSFLNLKPSEEPRIPKIVHQIWIGKEVPKEFELFQQSWKEFHPDWEYRLWTQHDIEQFGFHNIDLIRSSRNPGEISDIMRYEILYRHGGLYVDFDFECLRPHDELNYLYDFYIGIQPLDSGYLQLGIGLIGSVPGHPILKHAIEIMQKNWNHPDAVKNPPLRTGPVFFTRAFFAAAGKSDFIDVALPTYYCYPMPCTDFSPNYEEWIAGGAFGIHHWSKTWLLPQFRRPEFRGIKNYR